MPDEDKTFEATERQARADIARRVVYGSTISLIGLAGIVILAGVVVALGGVDDKKIIGFKDNTQLVFTSLLPLLGTWVGTILAFYFSKDNFQSASQTFLNTVKELTPLEKLRSLPVKDKMIPLASITPVRIPAGQDEKNVTLKALREVLEQGFNRIPILDDKDMGRYVIHQSLFYKFIAEKSFDPQSAFQFEKATLADFMNHPKMRDAVEKTIAFVGKDQTLADAKIKMDNTEGCQDVFVTERGKAEEPVVGWLTNVGIAKHAKV